jgi:radical SAM protein with 4Fe4S-binding SPASM domain
MKAKIIPRIHNTQKGDLASALPLLAPYSVHIDICSYCNFKCNFCFQSDAAIKNKQLARGYMGLELYRRIIDDLSHFPGKFRKIKIGLHGEPTLHPDLPAMIKYLKSSGVTDTIELFTNGSLLNPYLNYDLVWAGLDRINISVEGLTSEEYLKVAGFKIDMPQFLGGIKDFYENKGDCIIYIKIANASDVQRFYEMFGDMCDEIYAENIVPQWPEISQPVAGRGGKVGMYGQEVVGYKSVCPFPFMYMHFNSDGTVAACTLDWAREVLVGDIKTESALDIWRGERLKALRIAHLEKRRSEIPLCDKCLAPMVCCEENLDNDTEKILEKMR